MNNTQAASPREEWHRLVGATRRHIELETEFGMDRIPFNRDRVRQLRQQARAAHPSSTTDPAAELASLQAVCADCRRCELGDTRTQIVFGEGNPHADLMLVGEAPGFHEDQQGIPFIGPAGQLLTRIIEAIGLTRDKVYIGNVLKCRPPNNRTPLPNEAAACMPFLKKQIDIIRPRIIITMGNPATKNLLQTQQGITRMRGRFIPWNGIEVMPTFHPSYLLRAPSEKKQVWEDMQKVWHRMKELGLEIGELKSGKTS